MTGIPEDFEEDLHNVRLVDFGSLSPLFRSIHGSAVERVWQILAESGMRSRIDLTEVANLAMSPWFWSVTVLHRDGEEDVRAKIERIKYVVWGAIAVVYCDHGLASEVIVRFFTTPLEGDVFG